MLIFINQKQRLFLNFITALEFKFYGDVAITKIVRVLSESS